MRLRRQAIGAVGALLLGAAPAGAAAPPVPKRVTVTETIFVFRTFNYGRSVSVLLKTNAILDVNAEVERAGTVIARTDQVVPAGPSHDVVVNIPRSVAAGPATLLLKLTDQQNRSQTLTQTIHIPTPAAVPYRK